MCSPPGPTPKGTQRSPSMGFPGRARSWQRSCERGSGGAEQRSVPVPCGGPSVSPPSLGNDEPSGSACPRGGRRRRRAGVRRQRAAAEHRGALGRARRCWALLGRQEKRHRAGAPPEPGSGSPGQPAPCAALALGYLFPGMQRLEQAASPRQSKGPRCWDLDLCCASARCWEEALWGEGCPRMWCPTLGAGGRAGRLQVRSQREPRAGNPSWPARGCRCLDGRPRCPGAH